MSERGKTQLWRHAVAGAVTAVLLDDGGQVIDACGPLYTGECGAALRGDFWPAGNEETARRIQARADEYEALAVEVCPVCQGDGCRRCERSGVVEK